MSALSLKTQIEEEKGKKNVKAIIYFYALLSPNNDSFLNLCFSWFRYRCTSENETNNIFLLEWEEFCLSTCRQSGYKWKFQILKCRKTGVLTGFVCN